MPRFLESDTETCARCPRRVVNIVILAGGYSAVLCAQCANDWKAVIDAEPLFEEYSRGSERYTVTLRAASFAGGYEPNAEQITAARNSLKNIESKLYKFAERWVLRCST